MRLRQSAAFPALFTFCLLASGAVFAQRVQLSVTPDAIYLGEPTTLVLVIHDGEAGQRPTLGSWYQERFEVGEQGSRTSSSMQITNGRMTRTNTVTIPWQLNAYEAGTYELEPVTCTLADGTRLTASGPVLRVLPPQPHDEVFVEASIVPANPIREQEVTLRVEVGVRSDSRRDPLQAEANAVSLSVPWLELPDGLQGDDIPTWLRDRIQANGSFHIEGTTVSSGGFFSTSRKALFGLESRREEREIPGFPGNRATYWIYRLDRKVIATVSGRIDLGRAIVRGEIGRKNRYVTTDRVILDIGDAPRNGRPSSWTGAIGDLRVHATADPVKLRVGDPLSLTLTLSGVRLDTVYLPDLSLQPELTAAFKVHQEEAGIVGPTGKVFSLTLRPRDASVTRVPPLQLATYDGELGDFRIVSTAAIPITVESSELLNPTDVITTEGSTRRGPKNLERSTEGILANHSGLAVLADHSHSPGLVLAYCVALILAWLVALVAVTRHRKLHADPVLIRRRNAVSCAEAALRNATGAEETAAALMAYVADMHGINASGMTSADVRRLLPEDADEATKIVSFLEECEAARYSGQDSSQDLAAGAAQVFLKLRQLLAALLFGCMLTFGARESMGATVDREGMLLDAQAAFRSATDSDGYRAAAALYRKLIDTGLENGHLYYNLGNSHALAGEHGKAIAAYERALFYIPRDPDTVENLRSSRERCVDRLERAPGLGERIFFWETWLGQQEHAALVMLLATLAVIALLLRLGWPRRVPRLPVACCVVVALVAGAAYLHVLHLQLGVNQGVITTAEVSPRKGPGESYEPAFQKPLHEGAPFEVRETRGDWLRVTLPGGLDAWLRRSDVVLR